MTIPAMRPFSHFDPLLLLPEAPRRGLMVGDTPLDPAYGRFEEVDALADSGPAADAIVALQWPHSIPSLLQKARARLEPGGCLLVRLKNRYLPGILAGRLYPELEPLAGAGAGLGEIRRALRAAGFWDHEVYCWLPSEGFPYLLYPADEPRIQRFFVRTLMPRWSYKRLLFSKLGSLLPPAWLAPAFVILARKGR